MRAWIGVALVCALALCACDNGPSAVAKPDTARQAFTQAPAASTSAPTGAASSDIAAKPATPTFNGKPLWSSTRTYSSEQNAARAFGQNGDAFGAKDTADYVRMAHAFIDKPPKGAQRYKRPNGDLMLYDPSSNTFAVATKDGAPRTLFKPREGAAYWDKQMVIEKAKG